MSLKPSTTHLIKALRQGNKVLKKGDRKTIAGELKGSFRSVARRRIVGSYPSPTGSKTSAMSGSDVAASFKDQVAYRKKANVRRKRVNELRYKSMSEARKK